MPLTDEVKDIVDKIIAIPHDYHQLGNKSMYDLIVESGYMEAHYQVTKEAILDGLIRHSFRINEWVQWSDDQRVSEGWFLRSGNDIWHVGAFSSINGYRETSHAYPSLLAACATFIKLQLEDTRKSWKADSQKKRRK